MLLWKRNIDSQWLHHWRFSIEKINFADINKQRSRRHFLYSLVYFDKGKISKKNKKFCYFTKGKFKESNERANLKMLGLGDRKNIKDNYLIK